MEQWEDVVGSKRQYQVSSYGRVKSRRTGRILKQWQNNSGYWCVRLAGYVSKYCIVHRLMADAFLGEGGRVFHKNGIRDDNRLENLERK